MIKNRSIISKIRTVILTISMIFVGIALGTCVSTACAEQEKPVKLWLENENGGYQTWIVIDENTGVNYIVFAGKNGQSVDGCAITPRLNSDGGLYIPY